MVLPHFILSIHFVFVIIMSFYVNGIEEIRCDRIEYFYHHCDACINRRDRSIFLQTSFLFFPPPCIDTTSLRYRTAVQTRAADPHVATVQSHTQARHQNISAVVG